MPPQSLAGVLDTVVVGPEAVPSPRLCTEDVVAQLAPHLPIICTVEVQVVHHPVHRSGATMEVIPNKVVDMTADINSNLKWVATMGCMAINRVDMVPQCKIQGKLQRSFQNSIKITEYLLKKY